MSKLNVSVAPHIHSGASTQRIMMDVCIAMLPALAAGAYLFGLQALLVVGVCIASAVLGELLFNLIAKKKQTIGDFSAVVTGMLLGLNLSTNVPLWQCVVGSLFAILLVKSLFGGLGQNIVNPAIAARVFMLLAFSAVAGGADPIRSIGGVELATGATPLAAETHPSLLTMLVGAHGGAIGETCAIALLLGYVYLVARKVIQWYVPPTFVATVFGLYLVFTGNVQEALFQVLAGGLLLGAIFMATDYVTTPITGRGRVFFCIGAGIITFAIRYWGSYPEGVSIAILCMNLLVPMLERLAKKTPLKGDNFHG